MTTENLQNKPTGLAGFPETRAAKKPTLPRFKSGRFPTILASLAFILLFIGLGFNEAKAQVDVIGTSAQYSSWYNGASKKGVGGSFTLPSISGSGITVSQFNRNSLTVASASGTSGGCSANTWGSSSSGSYTHKDYWYNSHNGYYMSFTITTNSSTTFTLTGIKFQLLRSSTGPDSLAIDYQNGSGSLVRKDFFHSLASSSNGGTVINTSAPLSLDTWTPSSPIVVSPGTTLTIYFVGCDGAPASALGAGATTGSLRIGNGTEIDGYSCTSSASISKETATHSYNPAFGTVAIGSTSSPQWMVISSSKLGGKKIKLTPPAGFGIGFHNSGTYTTTTSSPNYLTITPSLDSNIDVVFKPLAATSYSANMTIYDTCAGTTLYSRLTGTGYYATSNSSDIIAKSGYTYPTNIAYGSYQAASSLTTSNSAQVGAFTVRDGGASLSDGDISGTVLSAISFTTTNAAMLRTAALFNSSGTNLGEVTVSGSTITFTGLSLTAADNAAADFYLGVTFKSSVTDNTHLAFTISSVTAGASSSLFAAADGGGAVTSATSSDNKIVVTATKIAFGQLPTSVSATNTNMSPAVTVQYVDALGSVDVDYTSTVTPSIANNTFNSGGSGVAAVNGVATFSGIQVSAASPFVLTFADGSGSAFTSLVSDTLYILSGSTIYSNTGVTNSGTAVEAAGAVSVNSNINYTALATVNGAVAPAYTGSTCATTFNWDPKDKLGSTNPVGTSLDKSKGALEFSLSPKYVGKKIAVTSFYCTVGSYNPGAGGADSLDLAYSLDNGTTWVTGTGTNGKAKMTSGVTNCGTNTTATFTFSSAITSKTTIKFRIYAFHETTLGYEMSISGIGVTGSVYDIADTKLDSTGYSNNFLNQVINTTSTAKTISVSAANVGSNDLVITPDSGFVVKLSGGSYYTHGYPLHITPTSGAVAPTTVYIAFHPVLGQTYSGHIYLSCSGVTPNLSVFATGVGNTNTISDPASFTATQLSSSQLSLSWSRVSGTHNDSVIIARYSSNSFSTPTDGVAYDPTGGSGSASLGSATIVYAGTGTATTDTGLSASTKYYYKIWTDSMPGNHYSLGITSNATTDVLYPAIYSNPAYKSSNTITANTNVTYTDISLVNNNSSGTFPYYAGCTYANANNFTGSSYSATADNALEFSITPKSGYQMKISSFHFSAMSYLPGSGGANKMRLAYSTNNGSTWVDQGADSAVNSTSSCTPVYDKKQTWKLASPITSKTIVKFRLYAWGETLNSGDELNTAFDTVYGQVKQVPTIVADTTGLHANFGDVVKNTSSTTHTVHFTATGLTNNVVVTANTPYANNDTFKVSLDGISWSRSVTVSKGLTGSISSTPIYVQFDPTSAKTYTSILNFASTGADSQKVTVTGRGTNNSLVDPSGITVKTTGTRSIKVSWTQVHSQTYGHDSVIVVRSLVGTNSFTSLTDGTVYNVTTATLANGDSVVYKGTASNFTDNWLAPNNSVYYYKVRTFDSAAEYSTGTVVYDSTFRTAGLSIDYFRSNVSSGSYGTAGNWQTSQDSLYWINTSLLPTKTSKGITIQSGNSITIDADPGLLDQIRVASGATLSLSAGVTLSFNNGVSTELKVDGTFNDYGNMTLPAGTSVTIGATGAFYINGTSNTLVSSATFLDSGVLTVYNGNTYQLNGGSLTAAGSGVITFNSGATYTHNFNGGAIPTATWNDGSTINLIGATSTAPTNFGQSFYNFVWNCPTQTSFPVLSFNGGTAIRGNCSIVTTNKKAIGFWLTNGPNTLTIGGDFTLGTASQNDTTLAQIEVNDKNSVIMSSTLTINGNFYNYGTFYFNYGKSGSSLNIILKGNLGGTSGAIRSNAYLTAGVYQPATSTFTMSGSGTQTLAYSFPNYINAANKINLEIAAGSTLDMGGNSLLGTGTFKTNSGSTLLSSNVNGLGSSGAIQATGIKTINTATNYIITNSGSNFNPGFSNLSIGTVNNLTFSGIGTVKLPSDLIVNGIFDGGTSVTDLNGHALTLNGTVNNSSTTPVFNGNSSSDLIIGGTSSASLGTIGFTYSGQTFRNFTINRHNGSNNGSVKLGSSLALAGTLTLTAGTVHLADDTLKMGTNTITGGSTSSYVFLEAGSSQKARLERTIGAASNQFFPIGDNYNPITIFNNGGSGTFDVGVIDGISNNLGAAITDSAVNHTWIVTPSINTSVNVQPQWNKTAGDLAGAHFNSLQSYVGYKLPAGTWIKSQLDTAADSSSFPVFVIKSGYFPMTAGGVYSIGVGGSSVSSLPVTLVSFKAAKVENYAALTWRTASEINNSGFDIERSYDGLVWSKIGFTDGHVTTNTANNYAFNDYQNDLNICVYPVIYYRLKQIDFNGKFEYSGIQALQCSHANAPSTISYYPNPVDNNLYVSMTNSSTEAGLVNVVDIMGKLVYSQMVPGTDGKEQQFKLDLSTLKPGNYAVSFISGQTNSHFNIVKK